MRVLVFGEIRHPFRAKVHPTNAPILARDDGSKFFILLGTFRNACRRDWRAFHSVWLTLVPPNFFLDVFNP